MCCGAVAHEVGHNFGFNHANSRTGLEYGDSSSGKPPTMQRAILHAPTAQLHAFVRVCELPCHHATQLCMRQGHTHPCIHARVLTAVRALRRCISAACPRSPHAVMGNGAGCFSAGEQLAIGWASAIDTLSSANLPTATIKKYRVRAAAPHQHTSSQLS